MWRGDKVAANRAIITAVAAVAVAVAVAVAGVVAVAVAVACSDAEPRQVDAVQSPTAGTGSDNTA